MRQWSRVSVATGGSFFSLTGTSNCIMHGIYYTTSMYTTAQIGIERQEISLFMI
jgi:hypothetical protein